MSPGVEAPVKEFLFFYFHSYKRGLPEKSQLPEMASFVTPELLRLFDAALKGDACAGEKEGEGPSSIEGDLFSSLFEGGTSAKYNVLSESPDDALVEIDWTNDSPIDPEPFSWKDQLSLVRTAEGWRISDFHHLGDWEFMMKGKVSEILAAVASECDP